MSNVLRVDSRILPYNAETGTKWICRDGCVVISWALGTKMLSENRAAFFEKIQENK
ncbi:MAG: hypothetical protein IJI14_04535 [Anaerolineaceae bacterium]|nr:hypothetical protein [Anaerolineaceae bacterium]